MRSVAAERGLRLPISFARMLLDHAQAELPNEACGLLAGDRISGLVQAFHPARNEHASPLRFSVDPDDLVRITYAIEAAGMEMVAIFHSHPNGPAAPSATDVRESQYPHALHLLSGSGETLRAWQIGGGVATEVPLTIERA